MIGSRRFKFADKIVRALLDLVDGSPQLDNLPALGLQILALGNVLSDFTRRLMPMPALDFNRQFRAWNSNVNIETIRRKLGNVVNLMHFENLNYPPFAFADRRIRLSKLRAHDQFFVRPLFATNSIVCLTGEALAGFRRLACIPLPHVFGLIVIRKWDAKEDESLINLRAVNVCAFADAKNG